MAAQHPERFHLWYVVEEPGECSSSSSSSAMGAALGEAAAAAGAAPAGMSPAVTAAAARAAGAAAPGRGVRPWTFSTGFVTPDMLAQHLLPPRAVALPSKAAQAAGVSSAAAAPAPAPPAAAAAAAAAGGDALSLALMCGPPGMLENVVVPSLSALGFRPEQMVVF
jgi:hypothetical protein